MLPAAQGAITRARNAARQTLTFIIRGAISFGISIAPVPHWVGIIFFAFAIACGLAACHYFYEYRCARIEASL
jgi:hypothetical protein